MKSDNRPRDDLMLHFIHLLISTTPQHTYSPYSLRPIPTRHRRLQQPRKIRCPQSAYGIPPSRRIPARIRDDRAAIRRPIEPRMPITPGASTEHHIVQRTRIRVQQWVQEAERRLARAESRIVEKSNDTAKCWCGARSSLVAPECALIVDAVSEALRRDVGKATAVAVEVGLVGLAEVVKVCLYCIVLIRGALPVVGEATGREESRGLVEVAC
jgi:hypothetical protein